MTPFLDSVLIAPTISPLITTSALGRSRPAADATREAVEHWLLDGLM
jgi:hypothetical protein